MAYKVTRDCYDGQLDQAKCNCTERDGGLLCELKAHYGYRMSKVVDELDMLRSTGQRKAALYLHNNGIGRAVSDNKNTLASFFFRCNYF